jgi:exopolyphosphatase/guanosine-5'-triphosphate,3'-diphosphate pyrophosphatase
VGVVDVGGGSSEIAIGTMHGGVTWSASFRVGSGFLADAYLRTDPPSAADLDSMRKHASGVFDGLDVPHADLAVAVGGSATSLRRLIGAVLDADTVTRGLRVLSASPSDVVARDFGLDAERVRLLPAGLVVLSECSALLGLPLQIGRGGLREGVCLELAA